MAQARWPLVQGTLSAFAAQRLPAALPSSQPVPPPTPLRPSCSGLPQPSLPLPLLSGCPGTHAVSYCMAVLSLSCPGSPSSTRLSVAGSFGALHLVQMARLCWAIQVSASTLDLSLRIPHCPHAISTVSGRHPECHRTQPANFEFLLCWQSGRTEAHTCLASNTSVVCLPPASSPVWALDTISGPVGAPVPNTAVVTLSVCLLHQRRVLIILVSAGCSLGA